MRFRNFLSRALAISLVVLNASSAAALIVHEGRVVPVWPDQAASGPGLRAAPAPATSRSFYTIRRGEIHGLTILVDFSDTAPAFTVEQIKAWLLEPGYSQGGLNGSIRDYYLDQSNGMLDFRNEVVGFVRAKQPKSYYEAGSGYTRATALVAELLEAIDPMVDFAKYDNDGDGSTDSISIVYAGPSVEFAQGLWPHAGTTQERRDGVRIPRYQMTNLGNRLGLYVFAHEVGHMLFGWPDLYGFGNYCIMGNSSDAANPVGINDVYRADQGWIPVIDITEATNARFGAAPNAGGYRYVNPNDPGEWFFWYNQRNTGRWSSLRGNGLLVLHFDHALRTNTPPNPLSLAVVQADGRRQLDETQWPMPGSDAADFYRSGGNNELSVSTNPSSKWNDGSDSGLRLYDIGPSGEVMTFAVGRGTPAPGIGGASGVSGAGGRAGASGGANGAGGMTGAGGRAGGSGGGSSIGGVGGRPASGSGGAAAGGGTVGGAAGGSSGGATAVSGTGGRADGSSGGAATGGASASSASSGGSGAGLGTGGVGGAPGAGGLSADGGCSCLLAGRGVAIRPSAGVLLTMMLGARLFRRRHRRRGVETRQGGSHV